MRGLFDSAQEMIARRFTIHYCQNISAVGQKVIDLKDRVYHMSVVIVETFRPNKENGSDEVIVKAANGIERDIKDLLR